MDGRKVGASLRALRRRRAWRQADLERATGVSRSAVSLMELGRLDGVAIGTLRRVVEGLDASLVIDVRWRGGALDRLLDERHAALAATVATILRTDGWHVEVEVSYSRYGERGSIDLLAWQASSRTLLVVEIKSELTSIEETLRKHDQKVRLAPAVAAERFGWRPAAVGRLLVLPAGTAARRRVARHASLFDAALPVRGRALRTWIRDPRGPLSGLWFVPDSSQAGVKRDRTTPQRVRCRSGGLPSA
ncbi:MAG: hypothetical protein A2X23_09605 [Chloroflexi bacterium GWC2_73_18]|nr:MAG: hypothetical protein A2X23_09605 [Chloroflexi bacterium GWC2_73_18]